MTGTSIREFIRIWEAMEAKHELGLTSLGNYIQQWRCNEFVRDALYSRYHTLSNSGIFYEGKAGDPDTRDDDALETFFETPPRRRRAHHLADSHLPPQPADDR